MAETTISLKQECRAERDYEHLCHLVDNYFHVREPEQFRTMALNPRFKCEFCGRTARDARNLCYPAPL